MPEQGISGRFQAMMIGPCPEIESGPGRICISELHFSRGEVWNLWLDGEEAPLGVTALHPIWSVDRQAWVSACELRMLERVRIEGGTKTLVRREYTCEKPVFNLEVDADHCYRVGEQGILVHNASAQTCADLNPCDVQQQNDFLKKALQTLTPLRPYRPATVAVGILSGDDGKTLECVFSVSFSNSEIEDSSGNLSNTRANRLLADRAAIIAAANKLGIRHIIENVSGEDRNHAEAQIIANKGSRKLCAIAISRAPCSAANSSNTPTDTTCSQRLGRLNATTCGGASLTDRTFYPGSGI